MKNIIIYTKEDIYMIVEMANDIYEIDGFLGRNKKEFIKDLINFLTLEEKQDIRIVKFLMKNKNIHNQMKFKTEMAKNTNVKIYENKEQKNES